MQKNMPAKRQLVLVLGMHRSGTSLVSGILCKCGIDFGDNLMPATEDNPKGYFEDLDFVDINDAILNKYKSVWHDHRDIRFSLFRFLKYLKYHKKIKTTLNEKFSDKSIFGIKDPRIARLLPIWKIFSKKYDKKYVVVFRSPFEVAESLKTRDQFSIEKGLSLWASYNRDILRYTDGCQRVFVSYENIVNDPNYLIAKVSKNLELNTENFNEVRADFVDKGLYRSKTSLSFDDIQNADLKAECSEIWTKLNSLERATGSN